MRRVRRRRRRGVTSPARWRIAPAVLGAGQRTVGCAEVSFAITFFGPHVGCARFIAITPWATATGVAFGWVWGARLRSPSPASPPVLKRLMRLYPVLRLIPNRRHKSATVSSPRNQARMNRCCSLAALVSCQGITALLTRVPPSVE